MPTAAPVFTNVSVTFDSHTVDCDVTRAAFVPDTPTLTAKTACGPRQAAGRTVWTFEVEGLQSVFDANNLADLLADAEGETVGVVIEWTSADGLTTVSKSADVIAKPCSFGGTIDELATFSLSLPVVGAPETVGS